MKNIGKADKIVRIVLAIVLFSLFSYWMAVQGGGG